MWRRVSWLSTRSGEGSALSPLASLGRSMLGRPPDGLCVERVKGIEPSS